MRLDREDSHQNYRLRGAQEEADERRLARDLADIRAAQEERARELEQRERDHNDPFHHGR
jgi:hypothetical protein